MQKSQTSDYRAKQEVMYTLEGPGLLLMNRDWSEKILEARMDILAFTEAALR